MTVNHKTTPTSNEASSNSDAAMIDVIVPVYDGLEETLECIRSVLSARAVVPFRLIAINDGSPNKALTEALNELAESGEFTLLENKKNLGFVRTVNRGMQLNDRNDVVLLNSDTVVTDGWLDRLVAASHRDAKIGTVTATSNNATIYSLPRNGGVEGIPYGLSLEQVGALCAELNQGIMFDIPTAHGFCMLIKRECIRQVGLFDAEKFGRGYGEENDFSQRAAAKGWRNVLACDAFVYHKGSVSFKSDTEGLIEKNLQILQKDFPGYIAEVHDFIRRDPLALVRNRLQVEVWKSSPTVVLVSLAIGGGVDINVAFLAKRLMAEGYRVLLARRHQDPSYDYVVQEWDADSYLLFKGSNALEAFIASLVDIGPQFLHVHHLIDLGEQLRAFLMRGAFPYFVTLHDYFYICPRVTMIDYDGSYCESPPPETCKLCVQRGGPHSATDRSLVPVALDIVRWRENWYAFLKGAERVFAPTQTARTQYRTYFSDLDIEVMSHEGPERAKLTVKRTSEKRIIRVAILGAIGPHKGSVQMLKLLRWCESRHPELHFVLMGHTNLHEGFSQLKNLTILGPYTPDNLYEEAAKAHCDVALFMSIWPETYSYTLSEALSLGLTPVAYDIGAIGERIAALSCGITLPLNAPVEDWVRAISRASAIKIQHGTYSEGSYKSILKSYYRFSPNSKRNISENILISSSGIFDDGWCEQEISLIYYIRNTFSTLNLELFAPQSEQSQFVLIRIGEKVVAAGAVEPGRISSFTCKVEPTNGLLKIGMTFTARFALPAPDERTAAALLKSVDVTDARTAGTQATVDNMLEQVTVGSLESTKQLKQVLGLLAQYNPTAIVSSEGPLHQFAADITWSLRIARRSGLKHALKSYLTLKYLRKAPFDNVFYRTQLKGNLRSGFDPIRHYVVFGVNEGFDPMPGFSTDYYHEANPDVTKGGVNAYYHFLRFGDVENRRYAASRKLDILLADAASGPIFDSIESKIGLGAGIIQALGGSVAKGDTNLPWPRRDGALGSKLFDTRPDDAVFDQIEDGEQFLNRYALVSSNPDWEGAVAEINNLPVPSGGEQVDVSIVVPVFGQLAYTLNALHSLLGHKSSYRFEILVADDASLDESNRYLPLIRGIKFIQYESNRGFIETCNAAASVAAADMFVFLNNDTRVCEGWLDATLNTFSQFDNAGLVGSKLFFQDGSLQEAGGIVWMDGSAWNYGRNDDPNKPDYCYAREVDYISGASLAISRHLWNELDGFAEVYRPAYYEDTDLAMRVRMSGRKVVFQPLSRVVHYEGKSSGTDTSAGVKSYQEINRETFWRTWAPQLEHHGPNGENVASAKERNIHKRALIVDATTPAGARDAGSAATIALILQYQSLGYGVTFVPEDNFLFLPDDTAALQGIGVECRYAPYDTNLRDLLAQEGDRFDIIHVIRPDIAARTIPLIKKYAPKARLFYLNADLHYLRMERQATLEGNSALMLEAHSMREREFKIALEVEVSFVHSLFEKTILDQVTPSAKTIYYPLVEVNNAATSDFYARNDVMFLGGFSHTPNVDAAHFLVDELWPRIAQTLPEAKLLIVGSNPPASVLALASDRIIVTGRVDDLSPWFARAKVFIAPLRYGAGAKGKVLSALSHGVPTVATKIAAEGLPLNPNINIHIADTTDEIIRATVEICMAPEPVWKQISVAGQTYVRDHHNFDLSKTVLEQAIEHLGRTLQN